MATYDPPQPSAKRVTAGILDFVLAAAIFGIPLWQLFATPAPTPQPGSYVAEHNIQLGSSLSGWPFWLLVALIVGYFVVLGRTGGTVFQRAFGMKRAAKSKQTA
jgi:uncharacterized RDD family membrane protein YckC